MHLGYSTWMQCICSQSLLVVKYSGTTIPQPTGVYLPVLLPPILSSRYHTRILTHAMLVWPLNDQTIKRKTLRQRLQ